jgi:hypothetical protein
MPFTIMFTITMIVVITVIMQFHMQQSLHFIPSPSIPGDLAAARAVSALLQTSGGMDDVSASTYVQVVL